MALNPDGFKVTVSLSAKVSWGEVLIDNEDIIESMALQMAIDSVIAEYRDEMEKELQEGFKKLLMKNTPAEARNRPRRGDSE